MNSSILKRRFKVFAIPLFAMAMLAAGCEQGGQNVLPADRNSFAEQAHAPAVAPRHAQEVAIDNFSFNPPTLTIAAGTTVTWTNHDDVPHTVTANDKAFGSKAMDTDEKFSHVFATPGTYSYFCLVHTHMSGKIIVQ